jgi:DNA polymerase-3 subunit epsilon
MQPHRLQAINAARELLERQPVYLDTETTGTESLDEVIEVAMLDTDGQVLYESLVKPQRPISKDAARVHGITEALVYSAPPWEAVWPQVKQALNGRWLAVYNIEFDLRMMRQSCGLHGIPWEAPMAGHACIMELFAQYFGEVNRRYGGYKWKSLDFAGRHFQIPQPNSHRARDDSLLSKLVLEKIAEGNDG